MTAVERLTLATAPPAKGPYSSAVRAGPVVVFAGQIALDARTGTLVAGTAAEETERVLSNLERMLAELGVGLDAVTNVTVYLRDIGDFAEMNAAYQSRFGFLTPARTTVGADLVLGARVEMQVWAHSPTDTSREDGPADRDVQ